MSDALNFLSRAAHFLLYGRSQDDPDHNERSAGNAMRDYEQSRRMWRLTIQHGSLGDISETQYLCDHHALGIPLVQGESLRDVTGVDHECEMCGGAR
jgi:hypothetical protein